MIAKSSRYLRRMPARSNAERLACALAVRAQGARQHRSARIPAIATELSCTIASTFTRVTAGMASHASIIGARLPAPGSGCIRERTLSASRRGPKPLSEPAVDRSEQFASLSCDLPSRRLRAAAPACNVNPRSRWSRCRPRFAVSGPKCVCLRAWGSLHVAPSLPRLRPNSARSRPLLGRSIQTFDCKGDVC